MIRNSSGGEALPTGRGAGTLGLDVALDLLELAKTQVKDYWILQLSFFGFFSNVAVETLILKRRLFSKLTPELVTDMFYWLFMPPLRITARFLSVSLFVLLGLFRRRGDRSTYDAGLRAALAPALLADRGRAGGPDGPDHVLARRTFMRCRFCGGSTRCTTARSTSGGPQRAACTRSTS